MKEARQHLNQLAPHARERDTAKHLRSALDEVDRLRASLHKLTENNVTYWDDQGAVRHDVGETQAEAMAIFREARALLPPNAKVSRGETTPEEADHDSTSARPLG